MENKKGKMIKQSWTILIRGALLMLVWPLLIEHWETFDILQLGKINE